MIRTFLCSLCMAVAVYAASAQIPRTFTLQCTLTDSESSPLPDGIHRITVNLYSTPFGGIPLYSEEFTQSTTKGLFHCILGEKSPFPTNVSFNTQYYIGMSYDGSSEGSRIAFHSVPYALMAAQVPDGSITSDKLSPALLGRIKGETSLANTLSGTKAFIGGGDYNTITNSNYASIVAGNGNSIGNGSTYSFIGGGYSNAITGNSATITGGNDNSASGQYSVIGGGYSNFASGYSSSIGGGYDNSNSGRNGTIGGGYSNLLAGSSATIAGGNDNSASANYSAVAGGYGLTLSSSAIGSFGFNSYVATENTTTIAAPNIAYFGNSDLWLGNTRGQASELRLYEAQNSTGTFPVSATNYTAFKAGAQTTDITYTLPATSGTSGQFLQTNGAGILTWESITTGAGNAGGDLTGIYPNPSIANGAITTQKLAAGVLPTTLPPSGNASGDLTGTYPNPSIANGTITAQKLAAGVLPTSLPPSGNAGGDLTGTYPNPSIANGTITAQKLAAGVLPTSLPPSGNAGGDLTGTYPNPSIANGTITAQKLAAGVLPTSLPPSGNAGGDLTGTYPNPSIANGTITAQKLAAGVLPTSLPPSGNASGDLAGNYPSPILANSTVTSAKIADSTILNSDISPSASIAYSKLNIANSIVSNDLVNNSVTGPKISADAVTTSKIADLTIQSNDLKDNSIITAKIADTNVTMSKIAKSAATTGQVIGWNGSAWVPTNIHQSATAATVPALQIGTTSSATGYQTFASKLVQNNISSGSTLAAGSSVYELTGTAPSSAINLPTGVPAGTSIYLLNSTTGNVVVATVGGNYTVFQYRAMQFLYSGSAWYPLGN